MDSLFYFFWCTLLWCGKVHINDVDVNRPCLFLRSKGKAKEECGSKFIKAKKCVLAYIHWIVQEHNFHGFLPYVRTYVYAILFHQYLCRIVCIRMYYIPKILMVTQYSSSFYRVRIMLLLVINRWKFNVPLVIITWWKSTICLFNKIHQ